MRPLRYSINVTLDGCVDHRAGIPDAQTHEHAAQQIARADALILGRTVYRMMEDAWRPPVSEAMPAWTQPFARTIDEAKKYVVSSTLKAVDWNAELVSGDLRTEVERLKSMPGEGLYTGGVTLATALAGWGLIDEYTFVIHPRVVGNGPRLFEGVAEPLDLQLVDRLTFNSGIVAETYVPNR
ncbi:dihydrofolate reductase family protein [Microbacterium oleivorans]|uniref:Riboflavin biosynthesis protein RibD protein n=1 Tax=Microbacterium oleivorans TaxID=273677 RepID=A0A031FW08_9MICO|nr:dihydrofolate reductase family protein [Microbacterium oleivorans]EZP28381.1 Riboflavin biosynthesis protein RibD protein [Microbacterium oleivorans]THE07396.1 deaminase [Microbacterium oleivorans]